MTTKPYSELYGLIEALCGCTFAAQEAVRVKYFINRRARIAYDESEFWPRFYRVGEERIVSEDGLLPYTQTGLDEIGTVLRIHASEPFKTTFSAEYGDFYADSTGIQITGYTAKERTDGPDYTVEGDTVPTIIAGRYYKYTPTSDSDTTRFVSNSDLSFTAPVGGIGYDESTGLWGFLISPSTGAFSVWTADQVVATPDLVTSWTAGSTNSGTFTITEFPVYSAYITYKAAHSDTYGDADGETADVPAEWFDYIAHGTYADFLRNDQQQDRAALAEQEAETLLMKQLEKIGRQNGSSVFTRLISNANTQWR